jgi:hypothetical protein
VCTIIEIWLIFCRAILERAFSAPARVARVASPAGVVVTQPAAGGSPAAPEGAAA